MEATFDTSTRQLTNKLKVTQVLDRYRWQAQLDQRGYSDSRLEHIDRVLNVNIACSSGWLGSHLYACNSCDRRLLGMNSCNNPHCPNCGQSRRDQCRESLIEWSLDCDYFQNVFKLPHELNPLIYVNSKALYKLLLEISKRGLIEVFREHFGCTPGIVQVLHPFGQRLNMHVDNHLITTTGGLSQAA